MKTGMDLSAADGELTDVDLGEQTKNSVSYGSWTLASRVTGLVRVAVVAGVLGPTFLGNTYQIAVSVPTLTFELTGALFASLLIPALVLSIDRNDRRHSERIAGGFLGVTMMGLAALTVVGVLASPLLFKLFSFSIDSSSVASEQQRVGVILLATLMPLVVLYGIVGTAGAVLNAHGRFALPAGAPIVENLGVIATMGVYVVYAGIGQSLASVGTGALLILGIGTTAAAALHAAVVWWGARQVGLTLIPRLGWRTPEVRSLIRQLPPTLGNVGLNALRQFAVLIVANRVPGGVVAIQLAAKLVSFTIALAGRPIAHGFQPRLSRLARDRRGLQFHREFFGGVSLTLFLSIPAAAAFLLLARPISEALAWGEMATPIGVTLISVSLATLALSAVSEALLVPATFAAYALRDARSPFRAVAYKTGLSFAGLVIAFVWLDGTALVAAVGLSMTISSLVTTLHLFRLITHRLPPGPTGLRRPLARSLLSSLSIMVPIAVAATLIGAALDSKLGDVIVLAVATVAGTIGYLVLEGRLGSPERAAIAGAIRSAASDTGVASSPLSRQVASGARAESERVAATPLNELTATPETLRHLDAHSEQTNEEGVRRP